MKSLIALALICFAVPHAFGGEIYGTIVEGGKPVPAGIKVEVAIAGKTYTAETDKFGSYRVFVDEKGKCVLMVYYKDQKPAADIFSYDKATRYDWSVETADGKLVLKRV